MSTVKNILSLASKSHGLDLDGLIHAVTSELRDALIANVEGLDENMSEKLQIWSELVLPDTEDDCIPSSECYQIMQGGELCDMLVEVWQLVLHGFISKAASIDDKTLVVRFLGGSFCFLYGDDAKHCCKELTDKFHALITCESEEIFHGLPTLLPCLLQIIENMLSPHQKGCVMSATQKEVLLYLKNVIVSFGGILTTRSIQHVVGVFLKSLQKFDNDHDFRSMMWESILEAFMSIGKSILDSKLHEVTRIQHCLHLLDILLGLLVSKNSLNSDRLVKNVADVLANGVLWLIIQYGLKHHMASVRKLALFNLRQTLFITREYHLDIRAMANVASNTVDCSPLFVWSKDSNDDSFWRDFLLLVETLEENQLHVITPVLKRFNAIVAKTDPKENSSPIHASWISLLLQRMMSHESKAVSREGVITSLKLNPRSCPFLEQYGGEDFLLGKTLYGLIPALKDISLFCDPKDASASSSANGEEPFIAKLLSDFLQNCYAAHPNPAKFLRFLLVAIDTVNWTAIPLFYFCRSLLYLPECKAWGSQDLQILHSVIMKCLRTHDIRLRHSIVNLLLQCLTKFIHSSEVNLNEFLGIITLSNEKCLLVKRPQLYKKILHWLYWKFGSFRDTVLQNQQDISSFAFHRIIQFCNHTPDNIMSFDEQLKQAHMNSLLVAAMAISEERAKDERNFLKKIIVPLNDIIGKGCTHLYLPKEKVGKAVFSINCLVVTWLGLELHGVSDECAIGKVLFKTMKSTQAYLLMRFSVGHVCLNDMKLYLSTWRNCFSLLLRLEKNYSWQQQFMSELLPLVKTAKTIFEKTKINKEIKKVEELKNAACSLYVLSWICTIAEDFEFSLDHAILKIICGDDLSIWYTILMSLKFYSEFVKDFDLCAKAISGSFTRDIETREVIEQYSLFQWSCIPYAMHMPDIGCCIDHQQALESFLNCLEKVSETHISAYFNALAALIKSIDEFKEPTQDLICDCIDLSWKTVQSLAHAPSFWSVFQSFVSAFFQKNILSLPFASKIQQKLQNTLSLLMEISSSKAGVLKIVCEACISAWTNSGCASDKPSLKDQENGSTRFASLCRYFINPQILEFHTDFIIQCLAYNPSRKKEDLALQNALKLPDMEKDPFNLASGDVVRLSMVSVLLQLDPESHNDCKLVHSVVKELLLLDVQLAKKKKRYHHNSFHHHVKNSIHQAVLVLSPFIPIDEDSFLLEHMMAQLKSDAQPSVRYLMEWMLALLVSRHEENECVVMEQLTQCSSDSAVCSTGSAKFSAICSFLTVTLFVGLLKDAAHQVIGNGDILKNAHPSLSSCLRFADNATGNVAKNWEKMKENFFLFDFHPIRDFSVESIYFTLPRLCGVPCGSGLKELFTDSCSKHRFRSGLPLFNSCEKLGKRDLSKWIPQEAKSCDFTGDQIQQYLKNSATEDISDAPNLSASEYNVQKKIMPWLEMLGSFLEENEAPRAPGLILVASLIDKPSNLGGLTRTCEIFGAEALVVQSLSCTADKVYQSLSVTAHQWLPMKEVKPWNLEQFLIEMRKKGYFLVGIEQTAQSVCLSKYRFPKRCILVLGNEKEGIPITLLRILDVCVQIPQKGIVRSLNVHVSGALVVWEYTRQHLSIDDISSNTYDYVK